MIRCEMQAAVRVRNRYPIFLPTFAPSPVSFGCLLLSCRNDYSADWKPGCGVVDGRSFVLESAIRAEHPSLHRGNPSHCRASPVWPIVDTLFPQS